MFRKAFLIVAPVILIVLAYGSQFFVVYLPLNKALIQTRVVENVVPGTVVFHTDGLRPDYASFLSYNGGKYAVGTLSLRVGIIRYLVTNGADCKYVNWGQDVAIPEEFRRPQDNQLTPSLTLVCTDNANQDRVWNYDDYRGFH